MGKRIATGAAALARRWQMRRSRPGFFIYFCHLTCRDYGKAKIWVGETPTALVFVLLVFFSYTFFSFPSRLLSLCGSNIWNFDKRTICEYANAQSKVYFPFRATTNRRMISHKCYYRLEWNKINYWYISIFQNGRKSERQRERQIKLIHVTFIFSL